MSSDKSIYPDYNKSSLVNLMSSILAHYDMQSSYPSLPKHYFENINGCEKLIVLLIDGFGLNIWNKYAKKYSFFNALDKNMKQNSVTSIFPSTTSAALTTMHTGLFPKEHGIFEWNMYFQELNAVISPLPYKTVSPIYDSQALSTHENESGTFINTQTIYEKLLQKEIKSYVLYPKPFAKGKYNAEVLKGATSSSYISLSDLLVDLKEKLESIKGKAYFFVYWPYLDTLEHAYGPFTEQTDAHIKMLNDVMYEQFIKTLDSDTANNTGFILTADHGTTACNPEQMHYLNQIESLQTYFRKTSTGKSILPSGNVRDVFLHIKKSSLLKSHSEIASYLKDIADIIFWDKEIINKFFGDGKAHPSFFDRLGDILILPRNNNVVWYQYSPNEFFTYKGTHGGITKDEMLIPLVANRLSALR